MTNYLISIEGRTTHVDIKFARIYATTLITEAYVEILEDEDMAGTIASKAEESDEVPRPGL